jgi:anti-anti-sigma factor
MLTVTALSSGDVLILECHGRIVRGTETSILCTAARQGVGDVVIDLKDVETIDAAGIGALVSLQAAGVYLTLANPSPQVREILNITKLDSIFEIRELNLETSRNTSPMGIRDAACAGTGL